MSEVQVLEKDQVEPMEWQVPHYVCPCNLMLSMCGMDIGDCPIDPSIPDEEVCLVCRDLQNGSAWQCPTCGCTTYDICGLCR